MKSARRRIFIGIISIMAMMLILRLDQVIAATPAMKVAADREQLRRKRLEILADLWGKIYLFHPQIVSSGSTIDWNKTLIETIPKVEQAGSTDEFVAVLNSSLFAPLDDPLSFVERQTGSLPTPSTTPLSGKMLSAGVGYIDATNPKNIDDAKFLATFNQVLKDLDGSEILIVDLRWQLNEEPGGDPLPLFRFFVDSQFNGGSQISRLHRGWNEFSGPSEYSQSWDVKNGRRLFPINVGGQSLYQRYGDFDFASLKTTTKPTIFLVNNASFYYANDILDALQTRPQIAVICEQLGRPIIPSLDILRYAEDIGVALNTRMLIAHDNRLGAHADLLVKNTLTTAELPELAKKVLNEKRNQTPKISAPYSLTMRFTLPSQEDYTRTSLSREERLLGLFKIWSVLSYFDPHLEYASIDWANMLPEWIPKVEAAQELKDYYHLIEELTAKLNDSHVYVGHQSLYTGGFFTMPVKLAHVQGKTIVVEIKADEQGNRPPLNLGDEIIEIDGKKIADFETERRRYLSASSEQALYRDIYQRPGSVLNGEKDSDCSLTVKRGDKVETIKLKRITPIYTWFQPAKEPVYTRRIDNIGYIDLTTIPSMTELDKALTELQDTDGLVLDLRGYPKFWVTLQLTARLCRQPVKGTLFEIPLLSTYKPLNISWAHEQYLIQPNPTKHYDKPVAVLVNEETQSMPEDFCIYLKNAGRVTFVGSGTTGTNGNITSLYLPAGGSMSFTGMRVKFGDGKRFQNLGITPDVNVERSVRGVVDGKDEYLDKGVEMMKQVNRQAQK